MPVINIKPLSVNEAWKGKRYKTLAYNTYEHACHYLLPKKVVIPEGKFGIKLTFGVSSKNADWDNPIKNFTDILQKKYGFNDKKIYKGIVEKVDVPKGKEYIEFEFFEI